MVHAQGAIPQPTGISQNTIKPGCGVKITDVVSLWEEQLLGTGSCDRAQNSLNRIASSGAGGLGEILVRRGWGEAGVWREIE